MLTAHVLQLLTAVVFSEGFGRWWMSKSGVGPEIPIHRSTPYEFIETAEAGCRVVQYGLSLLREPRPGASSDGELPHGALEFPGLPTWVDLPSRDESKKA